MKKVVILVVISLFARALIRDALLNAALIPLEARAALRWATIAGAT